MDIAADSTIRMAASGLLAPVTVIGINFPLSFSRNSKKYWSTDQVQLTAGARYVPSLSNVISRSLFSIAVIPR